MNKGKPHTWGAYVCQGNISAMKNKKASQKRGVARRAGGRAEGLGQGGRVSKEQRQEMAGSGSQWTLWTLVGTWVFVLSYKEASEGLHRGVTRSHLHAAPGFGGGGWEEGGRSARGAAL